MARIACDGEFGEQMVRLRQQFSGLEQRLMQAIDEIVQQADCRSWTVYITTLGVDAYQLARDIPVTVRFTGDDYVARFTDANVGASGDSEQEAIDNFKEVLVAKFELLDGLMEDKIGPGPSRDLRALRQLIGKGRRQTIRALTDHANPR